MQETSPDEMRHRAAEQNTTCTFALKKRKQQHMEGLLVVDASAVQWGWAGKGKTLR